MATRVCAICERSKELNGSNFLPVPNQPGEFYKACLVCEELDGPTAQIQHIDSRLAIQTTKYQSTTPLPSGKRCRICNRWKQLSENNFPRRGTKRFSGICLVCKPPDPNPKTRPRKKRSRKQHSGPEKQCRLCKICKPRTAEHFPHRGKIRFSSICLVCQPPTPVKDKAKARRSEDKQGHACKICRKCGESKPKTDQHFPQRGTKQLGSTCLVCEPNPPASKAKKKQCRRCGINKDKTTDFFPLRGKRLGSICLVCNSDQNTSNRHSKRCRRCKKHKPCSVEYFRLSEKRLGHICLDCLANPATDKTCTKCGVTKPLDSDNFYVSEKGGFRPECIECFKALKLERTRNKDPEIPLRKARRALLSLLKLRIKQLEKEQKATARQKYRETKLSATEKQCADCKKMLPRDEKHFPPRSKNMDGFYSYCRHCTSRQSTEGHQRLHAGQKQCVQCKQWKKKNSDNFHPKGTQRFYNTCRACWAEPIEMISPGRRYCDGCSQSYSSTTQYWLIDRYSKTANCVLPYCRNCLEQYNDIVNSGYYPSIIILPSSLEELQYVHQNTHEQPIVAGRKRAHEVILGR